MLALTVAHYPRSIRLSDRREGWVRRLGILALARYPLPSSVGRPRHLLVDSRRLLIIVEYYRRNVIVIKQLIYNDISSTKVRLFVRRGMSIK
jgi:nicotinic acid mononucleotide adenylyltransferase